MTRLCLQGNFKKLCGMRVKTGLSSSQMMVTSALDRTSSGKTMLLPSYMDYSSLPS